MNIDLNQIEAMHMNDIEAHYGRLETEAFRLRVAISALSIEMERRIKSAKWRDAIGGTGIEMTQANGDTLFFLVGATNPESVHHWFGSNHPLTVRFCEEAEALYQSQVEELMQTPVHPDHCGEECETCDDEAAAREGFKAFKAEAIRRSRARRSDAGVPRGPITGPRAPDHSSCCGAEGRRMNTETLDCAACREVVE